jgi:beta-phosphoglucomutase family hydrolase
VTFSTPPVDKRHAGGYQLGGMAPRDQGGPPVLGLPAPVRACLFDLDGVLTRTATVHAAAWTEMFDEFLRARVPAPGEDLSPFTPSDYDRYVDGRPRLDGTRAFLESRGIHLPEGDAGDPAGAPTVTGLGTRKNDLVLARLAVSVAVYEGSVRYVDAARAADLGTAVVSSSANAREVLAAGGIDDRFDVVVDGVVAEARGLRGKPAPDTFVAAATDLGLGPPAAAVFEDALAGVEAGRAGGFGFVVGVDRVGQADALREHGADVVVADLADLLDVDAGRRG